MSLQTNLAWRYAVKKFDAERSVDESIVKTILEAGNLSASSFGLQPYRFVVIRDQAIQDKLVTSSWDQRQVAEASHVIVISVRTNVDEQYINDYASFIESQRELPEGALGPYRDMMVGAIGQMSDEHRKKWATRQAYIAMGSLLAACADQEVDSCPMEGFVPAEYDEILGLSQHDLSSVLVLPIGYRADDDKHQHFKKVRKPLDEMVVRIGSA